MKGRTRKRGDSDRFQLIESAKKNTFSYTVDCQYASSSSEKDGKSNDVNIAKDGKSGGSKISLSPWESKVRSYFTALEMAIKFQREFVSCKSEDSYVFGDLNRESIKEIMLSENEDVKYLVPTSDIGCRFMDILLCCAEFEDALRNYSLHPFIACFFDEECISIREHYLGKLKVSGGMHNHVEDEYLEQGIKNWLDDLQVAANAIDKLFCSFLPKLFSTDTDRLATDFTRKSKKNADSYDDFLRVAHQRRGQTVVVVKANLLSMDILRFMCWTGPDLSGMEKYSTIFKGCVDLFSERVRKKYIHKFFSSCFQILKAPARERWFAESYFILSLDNSWESNTKIDLSAFEQRNPIASATLKKVLGKRKSCGVGSLSLALKEKLEVIGGLRNLIKLLNAELKNVKICDAMNDACIIRNGGAGGLYAVDEKLFRDELLRSEVYLFLQAISSVWREVSCQIAKSSDVRLGEFFEFESNCEGNFFSLQDIILIDGGDARKFIETPSYEFSSHQGISEHLDMCASSSEFRVRSRDAIVKSYFIDNRMNAIIYPAFSSHYQERPEKLNFGIGDQDLIGSMKSMGLATLFFMKLRVAVLGKQLNEIRVFKAKGF